MTFWGFGGSVLCMMWRWGTNRGNRVHLSSSGEDSMLRLSRATNVQRLDTKVLRNAQVCEANHDQF